MNSEQKVQIMSLPTQSQTNEDFFWFRVEQTEFSITGGFIGNKTKSAIIRGPKDALLKFFAERQIGDYLPGKIVVHETTEDMSQNRGYTPKLAPANPVIGRDNDLYLLKDGKQIWRTSTYVSPNEVAEEVLIQYNGTSEQPTWNTHVDKTVGELNDDKPFG